MNTFNTGIIIGRFQPIHKGHDKLINLGLSTCKRLLILVSESSNNKKNPFTTEYRISLINKIYSKQILEGKIIVKTIQDVASKKDLSPAWGNKVIETSEKYLGQKVDCIIYGNDKNIFKCFDKEIVENISAIIVNRHICGISATKIRNLLVENRYEEWKQYVNPLIYDEYNTLREFLYENKD